MIGKCGRDIAISDGHHYISGYFLGLDMTDRSMQDAARMHGEPWDASKGRDTFSAIGKFINHHKILDTNRLILELRVHSFLCRLMGN